MPIPYTLGCLRSRALPASLHVAPMLGAYGAWDKSLSMYICHARPIVWSHTHTHLHLSRPLCHYFNPCKVASSPCLGRELSDVNCGRLVTEYSRGEEFQRARKGRRRLTTSLGPAPLKAASIVPPPTPYRTYRATVSCQHRYKLQ